MKRALWLFPFAAFTAFAAYHHHWVATHGKPSLDLFRSTPNSLTPVDEYARRDGRKEARAALRHDRLIVLTYGLPVEWILEYRAILKRDYGIEHRAVAGCVVEESLVRYVAAYNEVMEKHIAEAFGNDVFEKAMRKAEAHFRAAPKQLSEGI